jgi:maleate isomerase
MGLSYSPGAAYGWRARIGLLQPTVVSDNNPFEFYLMAPPGVQLVLTSLGLEETTPENYERALANLETPVRRVVARGVDAIIQSGVPPLVLRGWGIEKELRERVAKLTPAPYITDMGACIKAMKALQIVRVVIAGGFDSETIARIADYVAHAGIEVVGHERVQRREGDSGGSMALEAVYRVGRRAYQASGGAADGVWLTPASIPTVGVIEALEQDLGAPVISSAQALMWAGLRMAGVQTPVTGFGRLLEQPNIA